MASEINSQKNKVITYNGNHVDKSKCRLIAGEYYKEGIRGIRGSGDCYKMDNKKWYRINTDKICWDIETGQYELSNSADKPIKVLFVEDAGKGYNVEEAQASFEWLLDNMEIISPVYYNIENTDRIDDQILEPGLFSDEGINTKYIFDANAHKLGLPFIMFTGRYVISKNKGIMSYSRSTMNTGALPPRKTRYLEFDLGLYGANNNTEFTRLWKQYNENNTKYSAHVFDKFLNGLTVGTEIETSQGHIPEVWLKNNYVVPVKDGSITGHEYITVPVKNNIIKYMDNLFSAASKYAMTNWSCSLHYHISLDFLNNLYKTDTVQYKNYVVALFLLGKRLQDEIFELFPPYKKDAYYLAKKKGGPKDHCQFLPSLNTRLLTFYNKSTFPAELKINQGAVDQAYNEIYRFYNDNNTRQSEQHSKTGMNKWDINARYYWLNFIPLLWGEKDRIEFRAFPGTVNKYKAVLWLLICAAILKYTQENIHLILSRERKIELVDVIQVYSDNTREGHYLYNLLIKFIEERYKEYTDLVNKKDLTGSWFTFNHDNLYTINIKNKDIFKWETRIEEKDIILKESPAQYSRT